MYSLPSEGGGWTRRLNIRCRSSGGIELMLVGMLDSILLIWGRDDYGGRNDDTIKGEKKDGKRFLSI